MLLQFFELQLLIIELTMSEERNLGGSHPVFSWNCNYDDQTCKYMYCITKHIARKICIYANKQILGRFHGCNNPKCTMGHPESQRTYSHNPIFANQNDEEVITKFLESRKFLKIDENFVYYEYTSSMQNSRSPRSNLPTLDRQRSSSVDSSFMSPNIKDSMDAQEKCVEESEFCVGLDLQYISDSNSNIQPTNWDDYTNEVWELGKSCSCTYCRSKVKGEVWCTRLFVGEHDMAGALAYTMNHRQPGERVIATDLIGVERPESLFNQGYQNWLKTLMIHDIEVHFGVDMRHLDEYFSKSMHIHHIQCNRPYTYGKEALRDEFADLSLTNRSLLKGLFESGCNLQKEGDKIAISIDDGKKSSTSRQVELNIVDASILNGYRLLQIKTSAPSYITTNPGTKGIPAPIIKEFLFTKTVRANFSCEDQLKAILKTDPFPWKKNYEGRKNSFKWLADNQNKEDVKIVKDQLNEWLCNNPNSFKVILDKNDVPNGQNMKSFLGFAYTLKSN